MRSAVGLIFAILVQSTVLAAGGGGGDEGDTAKPARPADPQFTEGVALIRAHEYAKAIPVLQAYAARSPNDADAQNYLGYASRKAGNLDAAFRYYGRALTLDPRHRGAHEYIGEAYLMAGNLSKAEEHLKVLDRLCTFSCEEYRDLKASIGAYKSRQPAQAAAR